MTRRIKVLSFLIGGLFVLHGALWYGTSLYFEAKMHKILKRAAEEGVQISFSKKHSGGYPRRVYTHLHEVKLKGGNWGGTIAHLAIEGGFFLPFTRQLHLASQGATSLAFKQSPYHVTFTRLKGTLSLPFTSLTLTSKALVVTAEETPLGTLKDLRLTLQKGKEGSTRLQFHSDMKFWLSNPLAPTLLAGIDLDIRVAPGTSLWSLTRCALPPQPIHLSFDSFKIKALGALLEGRGAFRRTASSPWEGQFQLYLKGISQFSNLLSNLLPPKGNFWGTFLDPFIQSLQPDPAKGLDLSGELKDGALRFKRLPFLKVPFPLALQTPQP